MKGYLQILAHFYNLRVIKVIAIIGILLYLPVHIVDSIETAESFSTITFIFSLFFPFLVATSTFRDLLSNRRFSLLPSFHLKAGLALLTLTVLITIFPVVQVSLFLNAAKDSENLHIFISGPPTFTAVMHIFIIASTYVLFVQFANLALMHPKVTFPILFIIFLIVSYTEIQPQQVFLFPFRETGTTIFFTLSVIGWATALYTLSRKKVYASNDIIKENIYGRLWDSFTTNISSLSWLPIPARSLALSSSATLIRNYPGDLTSNIIRIIKMVALIPLSLAIILYWQGTFDDIVINSIRIESSIDPYLASAILMIIILVLFSLTTTNDWGARARRLWLRGQYDRKTLWVFINGQIAEELIINYVIAFTIGGVLFLFSGMPFQYMLLFIATIISCSIFLIYFSFYATFNRRNLFSVLNIICILFVFAAAIVGIVFTFIQQHYFAFYSIESLLLALSFILYTKSNNLFMRIDWCSVKPSKPIRLKL